MKINNGLVYFFTEWVFKDVPLVKGFDRVSEIHYFLYGYQSSESDNFVSNGDGYWISDFMIYCDSILHEKLKNHPDYNSGFSYYNKIQLIQKDDNDGLIIFYDLFKEFMRSIDPKIIDNSDG